MRDTHMRVAAVFVGASLLAMRRDMALSTHRLQASSYNPLLLLTSQSTHMRVAAVFAGASLLVMRRDMALSTYRLQASSYNPLLLLTSQPLHMRVAAVFVGASLLAMRRTPPCCCLQASCWQNKNRDNDPDE